LAGALVDSVSPAGSLSPHADAPKSTVIITAAAATPRVLQMLTARTYACPTWGRRHAGDSGESVAV
jgi:hypothetical protein